MITTFDNCFCTHNFVNDQRISFKLLIKFPTKLVAQSNKNVASIKNKLSKSLTYTPQ